MTRPGPIDWAENANWAAGLDVGSPTKLPPSAAQQADGYYRDMRVAPQVWNYRAWAMIQRIDAASSMRVLNLFHRFDIATIGSPGGMGDGCWDPVALTATYIQDNNLVPLCNEYLCVGGIQPWGAGAGFVAPGGVSGLSPRIAIDPVTGSRAVVEAVAAGALPRGSVAYAAFAVWAGGSLALDWRSVCHTVIGDRFIFGDSVGLIHRSSGPAVITSAPATPPVWGPAGPIIVGASNHAPADVYPDDPGNDSLIAMTATQVSLSTGTGNVWTAVAAHGLANAPWNVAYSKAGAKWLAILGNGDIAESLDNGATWAVIAALPIPALAGPANLRIATDGFGEWIAVTHDGVGNVLRFCASWDDGATWTQVYAPTTTGTPQHLAAFYGGGQFIIIISDPGVTDYAYTTLRAEE